MEPTNTMHEIPVGPEETLVHKELDIEARQQGLGRMMEHLLIGTIRGAVVLRFKGCVVEMRTENGMADLRFGSGTFAPRVCEDRDRLYLAFIFASATILNVKERIGEL